MPHVPVMVEEFLQYFDGLQIKTFFDGTLGAGGHAKALLEKHPEISKYIGCDRDREALAIAKETLKPWAEKIEFVHGNFADLDEHLEELGIKEVDGFFFDLGVSSMQFDEEKRGFSFSKTGPLDMRMDTSQDLTAEKIINTWSEKDLGIIFKEYGEEPRWKGAAKAIVRARKKKRIETTTDLAHVVSEVVKSRPKKWINPATLIFQALRICVNQELKSVEKGLKKAMGFLSEKGRIGAISFHSLEDRIVKNAFREASQPAKDFITGNKDKILPLMEVLTKKPIQCTRRESKRNPRARSAKIRFAQRRSS